MKKGRAFLRRTVSSSPSRQKADAWAVSHLGGSRAWARALDASWRASRHTLAPAEALPERFESIGLHRATSWVERKGANRSWWEPATFAPAGTERVLIDLDGLEDLTLASEGELPAILAEARRRAEKDPRVARLDMLVTSDSGVHVRLYLAGYERDERRLYRDPEIRSWLCSWGSWLRARIGRGGRVDPARWSPGGYLRKPGWRLLDALTPFCVRFVEPPSDSAAEG